MCVVVCPYDMYTCDNGECVMAWPCDGTDDCPDGSDEKHCGTLWPITYISIQSLLQARLLVSWTMVGPANFPRSQNFTRAVRNSISLRNSAALPNGPPSLILFMTWNTVSWYAVEFREMHIEFQTSSDRWCTVLVARSCRCILFVLVSS